MPANLGFIPASQRSRGQEAAHAAAMAGIRPAARFGLPLWQLGKGDKLLLTDLWSHPKVVADVGFKLVRIHQQTGSCVWAGGTNGLMSTICSQRVAAPQPTKAFLPFTLHNYGDSRHRMGDDGEGDGSLGSTFAASLEQIGVDEWEPDGNKPSFTMNDGIEITSGQEYDWSSVRHPGARAVREVAKDHLLGTAAEVRTVEDLRAGLLNGYGASWACSRYISGDGARIKGAGKNRAVVGRWDGSGGHQQSIHGVWENEELGPLYYVMNNWPGSTYPDDPGGGLKGGCWVEEDELKRAFRYEAEVFLLSHLAWFFATPDLINWIS